MFAPGAEELVSRAPEHDHVYRFVEPGGDDRLVHLPHHLVRIRVRGRVDHRDDPYAVDHLILDQLVRHFERLSVQWMP